MRSAIARGIAFHASFASTKCESPEFAQSFVRRVVSTLEVIRSDTKRDAHRDQPSADPASPAHGWARRRDATSPDRIQSHASVVSDLSGGLGGALSVSRFAGSNDRLAA